MVRAVISGTKTQTRRPVKLNVAGRIQGGKFQWHPDDSNAVLASPYGLAGDRLWVRETWCEAADDDGHTFDPPRYHYRADGYEVYPTEGSNRIYSPWKPSIHMPRAASHITLEITRVRIERLLDISYADTLAEGIRDPTTFPDFPPGIGRGESVEAFCRRTKWPQREFITLWHSIYGDRDNQFSPLVWVIEFRRLSEDK